MVISCDMYNGRPSGHQWMNPPSVPIQFGPRIPFLSGFSSYPQWTPHPNLGTYHFEHLYGRGNNLQFRPRPQKSVINYQNIQTFTKRQQTFNRRKVKKPTPYIKSIGKVKSSSSLNPSDPLNLQDLMKETERRRVQGLSPLRGDSRMSTPVASLSGESPFLGSRVGSALTEALKVKPKLDPDKKHIPRSRKFNVAANKKRFNRNLPKTGNYGNYYSRRDPKERLNYLMGEWFTGKDIADYGCHNGTMAFNILDKFPDVNRIDGIDCDSELVANAKSMQRERVRWNSSNGAKFQKINFQVADWVDNSSSLDEPMYDTILAFSVTKWIHLNHGDTGLMRFFRRAFNLLKPGGHLILEPQPKSSYKRTRFTATQHANYRKLMIDPANFEPLLLDLGFSYFDNIKIPEPNQPFKRHIMLCSKSYGATPASIRNDYRDEAIKTLPTWPSPAISPHQIVREPPPVNYCPQTPTYVMSPNAFPPLPTNPVSVNNQRTTQSEAVDSNEVSSSEVPAPSVVAQQTTIEMESSEATPVLQLDDVDVSSSRDTVVSCTSPDSTMQNG